MSNIFTNNIARLIIGTVATASIGGSGYYVYAQNKVEQAPVMVQEVVASTTPEPSAEVIEVEPSPVVVVTPKPTPVPTPTPTMSPEDKQKLCDEKKGEVQAKVQIIGEEMRKRVNEGKSKLTELDKVYILAKADCKNNQECITQKEAEVKSKVDVMNAEIREKEVDMYATLESLVAEVTTKYCQFNNDPHRPSDEQLVAICERNERPDRGPIEEFEAMKAKYCK